eukprot:TRINITY_DN613_c1_g1_i1.p1 TRINITY_DN613_c1_g1~~TRINITY_DN613_c1_g1_i1.p1  ORF type:complete len:1001 (+),score=367.88 TRINITY_DN613_c1_g1_i1:75-3005(+)
MWGGGRSSSASPGREGEGTPRPSSQSGSPRSPAGWPQHPEGDGAQSPQGAHGARPPAAPDGGRERWSKQRSASPEPYPGGAAPGGPCPPPALDTQVRSRPSAAQSAAVADILQRGTATATRRRFWNRLSERARARRTRRVRLRKAAALLQLTSSKELRWAAWGRWRRFAVQHAAQRRVRSSLQSRSEQMERRSNARIRDRTLHQWRLYVDGRRQAKLRGKLTARAGAQTLALHAARQQERARARKQLNQLERSLTGRPDGLSPRSAQSVGSSVLAHSQTDAGPAGVRQLVQQFEGHGQPHTTPGVRSVQSTRTPSAVDMQAADDGHPSAAPADPDLKALEHKLILLAVTDSMRRNVEQPMRWRYLTRLLVHASARARQKAQEALEAKLEEQRLAAMELDTRVQGLREESGEAQRREQELQRQLQEVEERIRQEAEQSAKAQVAELEAKLAEQESRLTETERARRQCEEAAQSAALRVADFTQKRLQFGAKCAAGMEGRAHQGVLGYRFRLWQQWRTSRRVRKSLRAGLRQVMSPMRAAWVAWQRFAAEASRERAVRELQEHEAALARVREETASERARLQGELAAEHSAAEAKRAELEAAAADLEQQREQVGELQRRIEEADSAKRALAESAAREEQLRERLRVLEAEQAAARSQSTEQEVSELRCRADELEKSLLRQEAVARECAARAAAAEERQRLQLDLSAAVQEAVRMNLGKTEAEKRLEQEKLALEDEARVLRQELADSKDRNRQQGQSFEDAQLRLAHMEHEHQELVEARIRVRDLEEELGRIGALEARIAQYRDGQQQREAELEELREQLQNSGDRIEALRAERDSLREALGQEREKVRTLRLQLDDLRKEIRDVRSSGDFPTAPMELDLSPPPGWETLGGRYVRQLSRVRHFPYWEHVDGRGYLSANDKGHWVFSSEYADFRAGRGWVISKEPHDSRMPHEMKEWLTSGGSGRKRGWTEDATIKVYLQ